nr:MAG TPA: O-GlcNAcase [Caudoviricetes sp.]
MPSGGGNAGGITIGGSDLPIVEYELLPETLVMQTDAVMFNRSVEITNPGEPTNLTATSIDKCTKVKLSLTAPTQVGSYDRIGYAVNIELKKNDSSSFVDVTEIFATQYNSGQYAQDYKILNAILVMAPDTSISIPYSYIGTITKESKIRFKVKTVNARDYDVLKTIGTLGDPKIIYSNQVTVLHDVTSTLNQLNAITASTASIAPESNITGAGPYGSRSNYMVVFNLPSGNFTDALSITSCLVTLEARLVGSTDWSNIFTSGANYDDIGGNFVPAGMNQMRCAYKFNQKDLNDSSSASELRLVAVQCLSNVGSGPELGVIGSREILKTITTVALPLSKCIDIRFMVHQKKIVASVIAYDSSYDLNSDGKVDTADLTLCRKILLGIEPCPSGYFL